ncbi:DUF6249 domain-containing protein [Chondrinema litorale]|uniref:DUF6249 domain-containing protein n=1 Tax=Chondrinema litorale TaxID=2994555 RepID=UPI002543A0B4|nr:DUF6249 domain-containing protein [Chondrinema litorale]UZR93922.1 hypothetical protein OQ292_18920 [Chondrinema litorale]
MEDLIAIVAIVSTFGSLFGIIYIIFMTRHRERMAMIESGVEADLLTSTKRRKNKREGMLKYGIIAIGVSIGLLIGEFLYTFTRMTEEVAYFSMVFLCGGISMLIYYNQARKIEAKSKADAFLDDDFS